MDKILNSIDGFGKVSGMHADGLSLVRQRAGGLPHWPARLMGVSDLDLAAALERAAAAIARLDQALGMHPLLPAFLYRARLEAVRRHAAVDGMAIEPWHLAAILEGLRLRMDGELRIIDRGMVFEAARHALHQYQWITTPDFDQESEIKQAEATIAVAEANGSRLVAAAQGLHGWLSGGGARPPVRAALIRYWLTHRVLRVPVPLTGAASLRPDAPWEERDWMLVFLDALTEEAKDGLQLLSDLERGWFVARRAVSGRRRNSRAAAAIDLLAAAPLVSATTLAAGLGMAVKNAAGLLDEFRRAGVVVEVTHRSKRRLFGLAGLAPLREEVATPRRPMPGRRRGRPSTMQIKNDLISSQTGVPPEASLAPLERRAFDYSDLNAALALAEETIRHTRRNLDVLLGHKPKPISDASTPIDEVSS